MQGATSVMAYFNPNDTYYDIITAEMMTSSGWVKLDAPLEKINVHIRGGSIVPHQEAAATTTKQ